MSLSADPTLPEGANTDTTLMCFITLADFSIMGPLLLNDTASSRLG
jgi:hypothetical protein